MADALQDIAGANSGKERDVTTELIDLSSQPLPLRLLRVQQLRRHAAEPLLFSDFTQDLENPIMSAAEREASTERLLCARRRAGA